jgi:hypothetical protein
MSVPTPVPIAVNFNVEIDASGNINVFNAATPVVTNVIVAEHTLPVTALYDASGNTGLLELWEPSDDQGNIKVQLANVDSSASGGLNLTGKYQTSAKDLAAGLQAILCDTFDCSQASPFSNYTSNVEYYKQRDFGRVAIATYAHYLFGHVDATAAITNDKAFVEGILSLSDKGDSEDAAERAAAWTKDTQPNVQSWSSASSGTDANLAIRLVKALVQKGLSDTSSSAVPTVSSVNDANTTLGHIVGQVVGQDASRLMNSDNSERTLEQHILLRFIAGDVIYMNIRLRAPSVNVGATNQQVLGTTLQNMYSEENFTIKITLSDSTVPTVSVDTNFIYSDSTKTVITGYNGTAPNNALIIPEGVIGIANGAFSSGITNKSAITSITIPSTMVTIGNFAFSNFSSLTSITIPSGVTTFGNGVFLGCTSLPSITIPSSVTTFGDSVFLGCTSLPSITIPSSVTTFGLSIFNGCSSLTTVILPTNMTIIPSSMFYNCSSLTTITIPTSVTTIGSGAFFGCTVLTSISLPNVTLINSLAFYNCSSLASVTFTLTEPVTIVNRAFYGTALTNVSIKSGSTIVTGSVASFPDGCSITYID